MNTTDIVTVEANTGTAFQYKSKVGDKIRRCNCECGKQVVGKAIYRPGHDARHVSELALAILEALDNGQGRSFQKMVRAALEALPSVKLQVKLAGRLMKSVSEARIEQVQTIADLVIAEAEEEDGE